MKKKIAIIGGSYLQLPIVQKAQEMGLEVHCFAWADGAVCADVADYFYPISTVEKEAILKQCQAIGIQGVTSIASDVAVVTVNYVAEKMGLVGNPYEASGMMTNKYLMRRCFQQHDVPSPQFAVAEKDALPEASSFRFPVIVKPTDRSGSRGVARIDDAQALPAAITRACKESFEAKAIVEEFVEGHEISVETFSMAGQHYILQITDKVTTEAPYFVELEHHQPSELPEAVQERVRDIVKKALTALQISYGASHAELKITPSGHIYVIEIGARMGGDFIGSHLVKLSTGYDFLRGIVEIAMGEFHEPQFSKQQCAGVYFLSEETASLRRVIAHWHDYPQIVEAAITDEQLRPIQCSADRSGYLIYQSSERFNPYDVR